MIQIPRSVFTTVLVAALSHIGLSIPRADETVMEREVIVNVRVHGVLHRNVFGSSGIMLAKVRNRDYTNIEKPAHESGTYLVHRVVFDRRTACACLRT